MLTQKTFKASAISLNYVEGTDGSPALLLLHGLSQRWQAFLQLMPQLIQTHHVFAPDLRGHGLSGRVTDGYRGEDYSQDILEFIDHAIKSPVILFGHSLGGMIGVYVAGCRPNLVRGLIIGDSELFIRDLNGSMYGEMFEKTRSLLGEFRDCESLLRGISQMTLHSPLYGEISMKNLPGCDEAYLAAWARSLSHIDPETLEMTLDGRSARNWRPEEFLAKVRCPTLLLQGDPKMGALMTDDGVRRARELLPDSYHVQIAGVGHALHMSEAEPVVRVLTNFLSALE